MLKVNKRTTGTKYVCACFVFWVAKFLFKRIYVKLIDDQKQLEYSESSKVVVIKLTWQIKRQHITPTNHKKYRTL